MLIRVNRNSSLREQRILLATLGGILVLIGCLLLWRGKDLSILWWIGMGELLLLLGWMNRRFGGLIYALWTKWTVFIGTVISYAVLFVIYFMMLTPIGLLFRIIGRDALALKARNRLTHWVTLERPLPPSSYQHLY
jgi:hypothetical protein